jgi:hypothetical protein
MGLVNSTQDEIADQKEKERLRLEAKRLSEQKRRDNMAADETEKARLKANAS